MRKPVLATIAAAIILAACGTTTTHHDARPGQVRTETYLAGSPDSPIVIGDNCGPTSCASVGTIFTPHYYTNPSRVFVTASSGTTYAWFRVSAPCTNNTTATGGWQNLPGPYYGSTATCPGTERLEGGYSINVRF